MPVPRGLQWVKNPPNYRWHFEESRDSFKTRHPLYLSKQESLSRDDAGVSQAALSQSRGAADRIDSEARSAHTVTRLRHADLL
ncbi:unnamed protein product, partial [Iphiclides podalirius]